MYFAYIDESGTKDLNDKQNKLYVLTAIIIHENYWDWIHQETKNLKFKIWDLVKDKENQIDPPDDFELHMKEISRKEGYYHTIGDDDKKLIKIWQELYSFISRLFIKIVSIVVHKEYFTNQRFVGVGKWAFKLMIERLNRYVMDYHTEKKQHIMVVMDSVDAKFDEQRRNEIENYIKYGTGQGWEEFPERVIETPFIVDSKIHNSVQLADIVAYLVRRYAMKYFGLSPDAFFNNYCDNLMVLIEDKFYRHEKYTLKSYGMMIFPRSIPLDEQFWKVFYGYK
ncbi:MAG: DUF3800 domain-containing protein [Promethearchaeota archaeon]|jgi:hypothetical protein